MLVKPGTMMDSKSSSSFKERATQVMGGLTPYHYFDFTQDRAIYNGADVGTFSGITLTSGTRQISSSGHLVSGAANILVVPINAVTFPITVMAEVVRTVDTGVDQDVMSINAGSANDQVRFRCVGSTDVYRFQVWSAASQTVSIAVSGTSVINTVYRMVGRAELNNSQGARSPTGTLGTLDTSCAMPTGTVNAMHVGSQAMGADVFTGYIRRIGVSLSGGADSVLSAIASNTQ